MPVTGTGSVLPSAMALGALAVVALVLTASRDWGRAGRAELHRAGWVAAVAVLGQAVHFGEELLTGFHQEFPALFGRSAMPVGAFAGFNAGWLAIWLVAAWALRAGHRAALFPLWFLALATIANGVAHPAMSVAVGGYFPGLVSAPLAGVLGLMLFRELRRVTRREDDPSHPPIVTPISGGTP